MAKELKFEIKQRIGNREYIKVEIQLNDECNNGFNKFAITGKIINYNKVIMCGCIHEEILKHFPEFKIFVDLHFRDVKGVPMYPVKNGFYFLKNKEINKLQNHLNCNEEELNIIKNATSEKEFAYLIHKCGLIKKWEEEAKKGIEKLEELTGETFKNDKGFRDKEFLSIEEIKEFEEKDENDYFSTEQVRERIEKQEEEKRKNLIIELEEEKRQKIEKIENEYNMYIHLAEITTCRNYAYDSFKNELVFNWLSYNKISQEEFIDILNKIDYSKLPKDINIIIKE